MSKKIAIVVVGIVVIGVGAFAFKGMNHAAVNNETTQTDVASTEQEGKITSEEAIKKVEEAYGTEFTYTNDGMCKAGGTIDDKASEEYYLIGATQDGEKLDGGCFYVHKDTGAVYFNYPDGQIERLSDHQIVGSYNW